MHGALAVGAGAAEGELAVVEGGGAHDHPIHPGFKQGLGGLVVADTPTGLHGHADRRCDRSDHRPVDRVAGTSRVEVDHVDPGRAGIGEDPGLGDGIVAVDGLLGEVTLVEADALAATEVDGREQIHPPIIADPPPGDGVERVRQGPRSSSS